MSKTLVIAEKPSVGRDLAAALPGSFKPSKDKSHIEGDDYVITWAVGHLVGLAPPDEYDPKLKKWRFADLPILTEKFKLIPNDERSRKQLAAVHKLIKRDDVDLIVNACDAGREGELIFAYLFETAGVDKPVKRLWLNSMTRKAIEEAFGRLRDGEEMRTLEAAARSRRAARGGDPRVKARAVLARRGGIRGRRPARLPRPLPGRKADRRGRGREDRPRGRGPGRRDHE